VARAYEAKVVAPFAKILAQSLVVVSLSDREVSIRRSASAAFQENAGRHGLFPNGIEIITSADYFAIGNRISCFMDLIPKIARYLTIDGRFDAYRLPIINHLLLSSVNHWDINIRQLASQSLGILATTYPMKDFESNLVPKLISRAGISDCHFHGTMIAVGEIYLGLHRACFRFSKDFVMVLCFA
jgi:hypothetical protein